MSDYDGYLGYLKYSGELVDEGLLDARKAAQALLGFDEAVRYYVGAQEPQLLQSDFEFPVRIRNGSWEALIPDTIEKWITAGAGIAVTTYLTTAAKKMAERDFSHAGLPDVFRQAVRATQWFVRLGKHLGEVAHRRLVHLRFRHDNTEIGVPNSEGELLWIPRSYFDLCVSTPPRLLLRNAGIVENQRVLSIGLVEGATVIEETVTRRYRSVFTHETTDTEEVLFPEMHARRAGRTRRCRYTGQRDGEFVGLSLSGACPDVSP